MSSTDNNLFQGADHVSLTVSDLDKAIEFYSAAFGAEVEYRMGPFDAAEMPPMEDGRDWTEAHVDVPGARLSIVMVRFPWNFRMEMFQYEKPEDSAATPPRNCDIGARHVCIEVLDLEAAIAHLESHGCKPQAGPIVMEEGPCPPSKSHYIQDPFGMQLELVEYL